MILHEKNPIHGRGTESIFRFSAEGFESDFKIRPWLHGYVFKSFRFHIVAFSNQSTLDFVLKCLRFDYSLPFPCEQEVKRQRNRCVFK